MPSIVCSKFRVRNAASFAVYIGTNTYMFIGRTKPWTGSGISEFNPPVPVDAVESFPKHWNDMIALKQITSSSVRLAIKRYNWEADSQFDAYSATDTDLYRKRFYCYAVGNDNVGRVYKCLTKGVGNSTEKPTGTDSNPFTLSDGYKWKFMYEVPSNDAEIFSTPQFIPVYTTVSLWVDPVTENNPISTDLAGNVVIGHGANIPQELGGFYVIVNGTFNGSEGGIVTVQNDYRKVGIIDAVSLVAGGFASGSVYDTTTKITVSSTAGFQIDQQIQVNGTSAIVVEVGSNFLKINDYQGTISTGVTVTNGSNSATVLVVDYPLVKKNSGNVLFVEQRSPIARAENQVEALNIVLEF